MKQPLYYKDLLNGKQPYTEEDLGRKGLSLAHLVSQHIPVPPFFVIQPEFFNSIIKGIFKDSTVASLEEFRKAIQAAEFTPEMTAQIEAEYGKLSGFGKAWVAARSSIVAPDHSEVTFSGLLSSKLNIRGTKEVEAAVKEIFLSFFSERSYDYLKRNGISYSDVSTAIVIQKMVQAEVSGIMYTYDPITTDQNHVSIEAVFGLGDVLTDGNVNPDIYTVSKDTLEIVEKKIVPQEWMKVRKMGDTESLEHLQKITISQMWQYSQKLDDSLVRELTKLADVIERALGEPQVIEWAMERGSIYVLQAKPIGLRTDHTLKKLHETARKITSMKDIDTFSTTVDETPIVISHQAPRMETPVVLPPETLLFTGTPASSGISYGEALLIPSASTLTEETISNLKVTITKRHILVTDEFSAILEPLFFIAGGVITNFGGANSDVGLLTREAKIPAIVGTRIATSFLQSGVLLKIDGASGAIYRVDFIPEKLPEELEKSVTAPRKKKKLKKKKSVIAVVAPKIEVIATEIPEAPLKDRKKIRHDSPIKVFLNESEHSPFVYLPVGSRLPDNDVEAIMIPITSGEKTEIAYAQKIKSNGSSALFVALSDSPSFDAILQAKRSLAAQGIRRSKRTRFVVSIGTMYGLLNTKNLADLGVDGVLFDIPALTTAYRPGAKSVDPELWKLVTETLVALKKQKYSYMGMILPKDYFTIPLRKELYPPLKQGVTSIVFTEHLPHSLEKDVQDIENEVMKVQLG